MRTTTISSVAIALHRALDSYGCDADVLFERAGLDREKLRNPNSGYPVKLMTQFWELCIQATGDPCFGLTVGTHWHPTTLHALGYSWMASSTLKNAMLRLERYFRIVSDAGTVKLEETSNDFQLIVYRIDPLFAMK